MPPWQALLLAGEPRVLAELATSRVDLDAATASILHAFTAGSGSGPRTAAASRDRRRSGSMQARRRGLIIPVNGLGVRHVRHELPTTELTRLANRTAALTFAAAFALVLALVAVGAALDGGAAWARLAAPVLVAAAVALAAVTRLRRRLGAARGDERRIPPSATRSRRDGPDPPGVSITLPSDSWATTSRSSSSDAAP